MSYRAENNGIFLIAENVNLNNVSTVSLGIIPPGVTFIPVVGMAVCNTFTALSTSTISIGTSGGSYLNIVDNTTLDTFTGTSQSRQMSCKDPAATVPAGTEIFISVTPAGLPPGPYSAQISLFGYYS